MIGAAASATLFGFFRFLPQGYLLLPYVGKIRLPYRLYASRFTFWLGLPHSGFVSADYYPILPWGFLFLAGGVIGVYCAKTRFPDWLYLSRVRPLAFAGRHTMILYLAHQPLIIGLLWLGFGLFGG